MPLRAADFESAAYAIPPLRAAHQCTAVASRSRTARGPGNRRNRNGARGVSDGTDARLARPQNRRPEGPPDRGGPSLDDGLRRPRPAPRPHPARASPRRRPRAFNDLVVLYQDQLFALVVRMVPDRDQASDCGPGGVLLGVPEPDLVPWRQRQVVAQPDLRQRRDGPQRARKRRPVQPYPELDDESWQPPAGVEADPGADGAARSERTRLLAGALAGITDDQRAAIVLYDVEGYDYAEIAEMTGVSLGNRQVADPPRPAGASGDPRGPDGACSVADGRTDHDAHDPLLIAALLDRDASATERAAADDRRRSLSRLRRPVRRPARSRRGGPRAAGRAPRPGLRADRRRCRAAHRRAGRGTGPRGDPSERCDDDAPRHRRPRRPRHDAGRIARRPLARARPIAPPPRRLIDACDHCAELHADLVTLAAATRRLPTPARPRDYTPDGGRGGPAPIGRGAGSSAPSGARAMRSAEPLAVGLTTLGIAGLLVTAVPSMSFGSASSSAGGPVAAPPAAATGAGAPGFGVVAPEASGASDLSGEAATAAGASVGPVVPAAPPARAPVPAAGRVARCRELAAESRHDPGPAPTVAGDGRRAADQRERQGDRLGRHRPRSRGEPRRGAVVDLERTVAVARLGRSARRRARAVRDPSRRQAGRRPLIRARSRHVSGRPKALARVVIRRPAGTLGPCPPNA